MTSPLRYPGGKTRACKLLWTFIPSSTNIIVSPFFGGGSFELFCASKGLEIYGNDAFQPLTIFWNTLKQNPEELAEATELIRPLSKSEFHRIRQSILTLDDPILISAYYFAINRSSFSGSTFCGGYAPQAADGRFTESSIQRLRTTKMTNIKSVENCDFEEFIEMHPPSEGKFLFLDPPYYIKNYLYGRDGDHHEAFRHETLANILESRKDWILCYNDCEYIRNLYKGCRIEKVDWAYGMNKSKESNEIVILPAA
jgi:DNA adenine methylase